MATLTTTKEILTARAHALAERTADAYSWDNYGERGWLAAITMLLKRGYTDRQVNAIMRSKWTRWAADMASNRPSWRYGRTNGADLARFIDSQGDIAAQVAELVAGTDWHLDEEQASVTR